MSPTPGTEKRSRAMYSETLWPGSWPPSPGFAPCAILICSWSALTRYSAVTPKRAEATCLILERSESPSLTGTSTTTLSMRDLSVSPLRIGAYRGELEFEQTSQRHRAPRLIVDQLRVVLVCCIAIGPRRVLQLGDGVGRPHV